MMTDKLSKPEHRKLKKLLEPYGAIKDCAEKTGIHRTTITRILKTGEATADVTLKIRGYLQGFASRLFIDVNSQAA